MLTRVMKQRPRPGTVNQAPPGPVPFQASPARTIESVLDAVAVKKGERAQTEALASALMTNGIQHVCELEQLDRGDWDQLNVSMGLRAAIKAELVRQAQAAQEAHIAEELTPNLRRFLLMRTADGKEPQPIGSVRAMFLGVLIAAPADRQNLFIILCEMLSLLSGLILAIPISLQRTEPAIAKGWTLPPTLDDGMNALVAFTFVMSMFTALCAVFAAIFVAAAGWRGSFGFYESAMSMFNALVWMFTTAFFCTMILAFWHFFTIASSPYLMIGAFVIWQIIGQIVSNCFFFPFMADAIPLEVYHWPVWYRKMLISQLHSKSLKAKYADEALKEAAERRAAELRARMGIDQEHIQGLGAWAA